MVDHASSDMNPRIHSALSLLLEAAVYADEVATDLWQFSVELSALIRMGLTTNECRWLVAKGLAQHAKEMTTHDADRRVFQDCANLGFPRGTCFVIAERGAAYARAVFRANGRARIGRNTSTLGNSAGRPLLIDAERGAQMPTWDSDRQQLRVGRTIVKQFKVPAANQEAILAAFQEEEWRPRIDDPLTPKPNQDPKRRLHDTINSLNRNQKRPLLRFLGDGKGEGVLWQLSPELASAGNV